MATDKKAKAPKKVKKTTAAKSTEGKKTHTFQDFTIKTKRSGRFLVTGKDGKTVNGPAKSKVLVDAKLVSAGTPKAAAAEEAPTT